jgi:uncharacterized protein YciI
MVLIVIALFAVACAAPNQEPAPTLPPVADAVSAQHDRYVLVWLRSGEADAASKTPDERRLLQEGHMANISRLVDEKKIVVAGPFGQPNPDPALRGLFIFDVPTTEEALALCATDPAVMADALRAEAVPARIAADLGAVIARDLADAERRKQEGNVDMAAGMRAYVLAVADDAERAAAHLSTLPELIWEGRLGEEGAPQRGLYLLDATTVDPIVARIGPLGDQLGPVQLYPWWGSSNLAGSGID